jgi:hypothetical protein
MSRCITLFLDRDPGITLKTLYDICIYSGEKYEELRGIHPLLRYECGLAIPIESHRDKHAVYKIKLLIGWNRGIGYTQDCAWNIYIPENWKDELPNHRLFHASVNRKQYELETRGTGWELAQKELDAKADAFAYCHGEGVDMRWNKVIVTLDCSYGNYGEKMPNKMFNSLKNSLKDMGLCNEPAQISRSWTEVMKDLTLGTPDIVFRFISRSWTEVMKELRKGINM